MFAQSSASQTHTRLRPRGPGQGGGASCGGLTTATFWARSDCWFSCEATLVSGVQKAGARGGLSAAPASLFLDRGPPLGLHPTHERCTHGQDDGDGTVRWRLPPREERSSRGKPQQAIRAADEEGGPGAQADQLPARKPRQGAVASIGPAFLGLLPSFGDRWSRGAARGIWRAIARPAP